MTPKRYYYILVSLAIVLMLMIAGSALGSDKILSLEAANLSKLKAESQSIEELQDSLIRNKSDLTRYKELNEIAKAIVPQDKDQAQTIREIVNIARSSGIDRLSSVTFPSSTLGGVGVNNNITQVTKVPGINGVFLLPITVTVNDDNAVTFSQLIAFLSGLEQNRRTAQVTSLNLHPNEKNPEIISFSIIINEYIKP